MPQLAAQTHIFGIRHHGPGSARSLAKSLEALKPDIILVEGPADASDAIPLLGNDKIKPPISLLLYAPDQLDLASYYPFAVFSPEWQAIQYGLTEGIPVRFMDLPQSHQMAERLAQQQKALAALEAEDLPDKNLLEETGRDETEQQSEPPKSKPLESERPEPEPPEIDAKAAADLEARNIVLRDPLAWLAEAAGYSDSERWWEHMVEQRQGSFEQEHIELFQAILEAMTALREEVEQAYPPDLTKPADLREARREAYMRRSIRQAQKEAKAEGWETIAVVCGAWHGPALCGPFPKAKQDNTLLKGLPKLKVKATWIPWTYGRLSNQSGYGAGIDSPGWYEHLWRSSQSAHRPDSNSSQTAIRWMTRVARLLRKEDLEASSASVIEAVRLAEALAAMRDSAMPGLAELNEATQTVLCFGDEAPLKLIHQALIVSDRLGKVPDDLPQVPLQQDLQRQQKRLRLKPEANERLVTLDLRKPMDLERSQLLHRLSLLKIRWGQPKRSSGKGTFKEAWQIRWRPELSLAVIEAGVWGNTVAIASQNYACDQANAAADLPKLTELLDRLLLAALPEAIAHLMTRLQAAAAVASDVAHLMKALPSLANILRYRDVRQTDSAIVGQVVDGLVARICIGLPGACASLDNDAAAQMLQHIDGTHSAIQLLQQANHSKAWSAVLLQLSDRGLSNQAVSGKVSLHGLIAGRCCRMLLDEGSLTAEETARQLGLALSVANEPVQAAAWVEGFLQGSGLLLLHDDGIWHVLDGWVTGLSADAFTALLPLLRRTFSAFPAPERRQMGERVRGGPQVAGQTAEAEGFDRERADAVLPLVARLLGVG